MRFRDEIPDREKKYKQNGTRDKDRRVAIFLVIVMLLAVLVTAGLTITTSPELMEILSRILER